MGSAIKFTGLSSGLDTQSIVEAMLTSYQSKIDTAKGNKVKAEWKKEIYSELSTKLNALKKSASTLKTATSSASIKANVSNSSAITVNTSGKYTSDSTHSVQVNQLATEARVSTKTISSSGSEKITSSTNLSTLLSGSARDTTIKIGNAEVKMSEATTLQDVVDQVKAQDDTIDISFDDNVGAFIITSSDTGAAQSISLTDASGNAPSEGSDAYEVFKTLGIGKVQGNTIQDTYEGTDAEILYNGSLTVTSSSNDFTVNGLSFTAEMVTENPVKVSISKDTEKITSLVTDFIKEYNSILSEITTKVNAESASSYSVLTDEEKEAMTEKEIETWENKIKGSLLRNDSTLKSLYNSMRSVMGSNYSAETGNDSYCLLSQIGISSDSWTDRGQLTIDEDKLASAIEADADAVLKLCNTISSNIEQTLVKASSSTSVRSYGQYFGDKLMTDQISSYSTAIDKAQDRYDTMESYYYTKFTAMETALNKLNSSSSLFSSL